MKDDLKTHKCPALSKSNRCENGDLCSLGTTVCQVERSRGVGKINGKINGHTAEHKGGIYVAELGIWGLRFCSAVP